MKCQIEITCVGLFYCDLNVHMIFNLQEESPPFNTQLSVCLVQAPPQVSQTEFLGDTYLFPSCLLPLTLEYTCGLLLL